MMKRKRREEWIRKREEEEHLQTFHASNSTFAKIIRGPNFANPNSHTNTNSIGAYTHNNHHPAGRDHWSWLAVPTTARLLFANSRILIGKKCVDLGTHGTVFGGHQPHSPTMLLYLWPTKTVELAVVVSLIDSRACLVIFFCFPLPP